MNILKSVAQYYFKPKKIEFFNGKPIYEFMGIRFFKKYLPTTGDVVNKWRRIEMIKATRSDRFGELYKYEIKTRSYELRHLLGIVVFIFIALSIERRFSIFDWVFTSILNLYVNIYPIFLQRYNRIRIIKTLENNGYDNPH